MGHLLEAFLLFHSPRPRPALTFWSWFPHFCSFHCSPWGCKSQKITASDTASKESSLWEGRGYLPLPIPSFTTGPGAAPPAPAPAPSSLSTNTQWGPRRGTCRGRNRIQLGFAMQVTENQKMQKAGSPVSGRGLWKEEPRIWSHRGLNLNCSSVPHYPSDHGQVPSPL